MVRRQGRPAPRRAANPVTRSVRQTIPIIIAISATGVGVASRAASPAIRGQGFALSRTGETARSCPGPSEHVQIVVRGGEREKEHGRRIGRTHQGLQHRDSLRISLLQIETGAQPFRRFTTPRIALQGRSKLGFCLRQLVLFQQGLSQSPVQVGVRWSRRSAWR